MIDNTHVVVLRGTGREMIPVPEMEAFAERFGFQLRGAERSATPTARRAWNVRSAFIENNFLAGRTFGSWEDLNQQARQWCDKVNSTYKKHIRAVPRELFAVERLHLKPLPAWIPEVYRLHQRMVDMEGYVAVNSHSLLGSGRLDRPPRGGARDQGQDRDSNSMRATSSRTGASLTPSTSASCWPNIGRRAAGRRQAPRSASRRKGHRHRPRRRLADYVAALKQKGRKVVTLALRQLLRLVREYPREPLPGRGARSRPVWTLRSGPAGTDDSAPRDARLLSLLDTDSEPDD